MLITGNPATIVFHPRARVYSIDFSHVVPKRITRIDYYLTDRLFEFAGLALTNISAVNGPFNTSIDFQKLTERYGIKCPKNKRLMNFDFPKRPSRQSLLTALFDSISGVENTRVSGKIASATVHIKPAKEKSAKKLIKAITRDLIGDESLVMYGPNAEDLGDSRAY